MARTAFLSGHTDLMEQEFKDFYAHKLDKAVAQGHDFVTAAAFGTDLQCLEYLFSKKVDPKRITVYLHEKYFSRKAGYEEKGVLVKGPFPTHQARDEQLTKDSDYDILWIRNDERAKAKYGDDWKKDRKSSVELNLDRRSEVTQQMLSQTVSPFGMPLKHV